MKNIRKTGGVLDHLVRAICTENPLQGKTLYGLRDELDPGEIANCEALINFYINQGDDIETQAASYLHFVDDVMQETKYFFEHDNYRYHSFEEVASKVYFDPVYMHDYMQGLGLSQYLWTQHLCCTRFFREVCESMGKRKSYLEIGPGHGQYLGVAVQSGVSEQYTVVDVSQSSLDFTRKFLDYFMPNALGKVRYVCKEVGLDKLTGQYDFLVMCEVLEHVERPLEILQNLRCSLMPGGKAFVSVPVNAPVVDHIYLFRTVEEVTSLAQTAGFKVLEERMFPTRNRTLEQAVKRKDAILVAMLLE